MSVKKQLVLAVFLVPLLFSTPATSQQFPFGQNQGILGTWVATATIISPPAGFPPGFEALVSVAPGGAVILTTNLPNGVTPGQGTWKQTGPNTFTWTFYFYSPPIPAFSAYPLLMKTQVIENIKITGKGDTYETKALIQPLNPLTGAVLESIAGNVTATRLALVNYNQKP